jgi:hypothetical protein
MAFRVGQKVARYCGEDSYGRPCEPPPLNVPVTISNIFIIEDGTVHLEILEYPIPEDEEFYAGVRADCFRPVQSTNTGMAILEQIRRDVSNKTALPIREDEQA